MDRDALLLEWKEELEKALKGIPKSFRSERTVRRTLQCHLYARLVSRGYKVVADYMPPRIAERPVDILVMDEKGAVPFAFCLDAVITLPAVKSLGSFQAECKVIYTMGHLEKKVMESRFFLKPEIIHHHLGRELPLVSAGS